MTVARRLTGFVVAAAIVACGGGDSSTTPNGEANVASVTVSVSSLVLQVGQSFSLGATPLDSAGHVVTGVTVTWSSSALPVASVAATGVITAVAAGTSTITASVGTHSKTLTLTVIPSVRRVSVSPPSATVELGYTLQLSLILLDQLENQINVTVPSTWTSSNETKASVSATGLVTPHDTGAVTIIGSMSTGGAAPQTASTTVTGTPHIQVVSVDVNPNPVGLIVGQTRTLAAFARDHNNNVIVGRPFVWSSQGPASASVGATTGLVTALQVGAAQISAVTEGVTGAAGVTVFAPATAATLGLAFNATTIVDQFVQIASGNFVMGSTNANLDERPTRTVTMSAFKIQKTEVTRAQWLAVMGSLPAGNSATCSVTCPVVGITWDQAQSFVTALNAAFPGNGFRLPTEAQWEYAARATTTASTPGALELIADYIITSESHIWPVALRLPNPWGLYDVIGNASEWTLDFYPATTPASYDPTQTVDPTGPITGPKHVDRGGAYSSTAFTATSSYRAGSPSDQIGLRLVRN